MDVILVSEISKSFSPVEKQHPFWALNNISFSLKQGDLLAIIGKNGSGKSTLLKILSEIYKPTSGKAVIKGTVASVLDFGTGFHPDLTGRENIFFYGALTGFKHSELLSKFDEIIDFSGLAAFIDTPIRNYSNGMFVRLAVSVILSLRYDVLILDEVIGAGDSEFRLKMSERLKNFNENGTTILLASHNMNELFRCNSVLWLEAGQMKKFGYDKNILIEYLEQSVEGYQAGIQSGNTGVVTTTGINCSGVKLEAIAFTDQNHIPKSAFTYHEDIYLRIDTETQKAGVPFPFEFGIYDAQNNLVFGTSYQTYDPLFKTPPGENKVQFTAIFPRQFFNIGTYYVNIYGVESDGRFRDLGKNVITFTVIMPEKTAYAPRGGFTAGIIRPHISWQMMDMPEFN